MARPTEFTPYYPSPEASQAYRFESVDILAHLAVAATGIGLLEPSRPEHTPRKTPESHSELSSYELSLADLAIWQEMRTPRSFYN